MDREHNIPGLRRVGDKTPEGREVVGPTDPFLVPLPKMNMLSQVRQKLDDDAMAELKTALIRVEDDGSRSIGLIQPVTLGYFTRDEAIAYIERINQTWKSAHSIDDLEPLSDEAQTYLIVIAGHRRTIGIGQAADEIGIDKESIDVSAHIRFGSEISFREAVVLQYRENFHARPDSWEDARAINAILSEGINSGDYETFADCARDLGISFDRVSRAYRFQTLPDQVQMLVETNSLSFGRAVMLGDVFTAIAYKRIHEKVSPDIVADFISRLRQNKLYLPDVMEHIPEEYHHIRQSLLETFLSHTTKVSTLPNNHAAKRYCQQVQHDMLSGDQLALVALSERDIILERERHEREASRLLALASLRTLVAVLTEDKERLRYGRRAALARSPIIAAQLETFMKGLEVAAGLVNRNFDDAEIVDNALQAGRQVLEELEDDAVGEDVMVQAMLNQELM